MTARKRTVLLVSVLALPTAVPAARAEGSPEAIWKTIAPHFSPPAEFAGRYGDYRSPLTFADGSQVKTAADWPRRRAEILKTWHDLMGPWPPLIDKPEVRLVEEVRAEGLTRRKVTVEIAPGRTTPGYVLVPDGKGPFPAVLVVYYDPETAVGLNREKGKLRDFALQLTRRGFVAMSIGTPAGGYYPSKADCSLQPLSFFAYVAANCYNALAAMPQVDPARVGVTGHSYGGKWSMFASCLYDKFAAAAWSDGGIVFDEKRSNVNYWEPWYLGWDKDVTRKPGIPNAERPRTGAYRKMIEAGRDLHELHALTAPRPLLVSGGSEDRPERWVPLNHTIAVNKLLGYENRVMMTNRSGHSPTEESNEQLYAFFEYFLKHGKAAAGP